MVNAQRKDANRVTARTAIIVLQKASPPQSVGVACVAPKGAKAVDQDAMSANSIFQR